mgnify:CR=1 FL=1
MNMIELGIIPAITSSELHMMLGGLSESDRKKLNRKFRKVWRKIAKTDPKMAEWLGLGRKDPLQSHIKRRSVIVVNRISGMLDSIREDQAPVPLQPW